MDVVLLFLVIEERMHPVTYGSIWNHLQIEILQDKLRTLGKNSNIFLWTKEAYHGNGKQYK